MKIGTTEAAFLLGISPQRLRKLLQEKRIKGAEKVGRFWQIPWDKGIPEIIECARGPSGTWKKLSQRVPTYIHVNQNILRQNTKNNTLLPAIAIKQGIHDRYCHAVEITGPSRIVYSPHRPKACGARIWLEIEPHIPVIPKFFQGDISLPIFAPN